MQPVSRQRIGKHISAQVQWRHATMEETVFSMPRDDNAEA
jgi:hypothetical protein